MRRVVVLAVASALLLGGCIGIDANNMNSACRDHRGVANYVKGKQVVVCRDGTAIDLD